MEGGSGAGRTEVCVDDMEVGRTAAEEEDGEWVNI